MATIEQLIASGRLAEAAERLEAEGQLQRATEIYEQIWDYAGALRAARAAGDLPRALNNALRGRDHTSVELLLGELDRATRDLQLRAAEVCQQRGATAAAARLLRSAGAGERAAELFEHAGLHLQAARLFETTGQLKRAIGLYHQHLQQVPDATDAALALGRLLLRFGRPAEALPLLQRAQQGPELLPAGRAAIAALARLGYMEAAAEALRLLRERLTARGMPPAELDAEVGDLARCEQDPAHRAGDDARPVLAGRYQLGRLLGSGGMGRVYLAHDRLLGRPVAVKVFTAPGGARGRDAFRRFAREARATGQLRHPHIVSLVEFNEEVGFLALEHMEGGTLADRLRPRLGPSATRSVLLQVLAGLGAAHQRGIVHRDIKPSNIFFSATGIAKLGDFGVAHLQDTGQTQTGAFVGTLAFMSPEQIVGDPITFATDIYALGVTLFVMLVGQPPFKPPGLIDKHLSESPPAPSALRPTLPTICDEVVRRCLAKDPTQRYASLAALQQAIEAFPVEEAPASKPTAATDAPPAQARRATDARFAVESTTADHPAVQIIEARDAHLGRPVTLVRVAPGKCREAVLALIRAAARGHEHLQRVLALDLERGHAVLQSIEAVDPAGPVVTRAAALRRCQQLASALQPLHEAGLGHGAVDARAVLGEEAHLMLALVPAILARRVVAPTPEPAADIAALLRLLALEADRRLDDAAALLHWAGSELARETERLQADRHRGLLERALAEAPPGVDRGEALD